MKLRFVSLSVILFVALLLSACSGSAVQSAPTVVKQTEPTTAPEAEDVKIEVDLTEYQFSPDSIEIKVGQSVTFILNNKGALEHELMIGRDVKMVDNKPAGYQVDMFQQANVEPMIMEPESMTEHDDMDNMQDEAMTEHDENHTGVMAMVPENAQTTLQFVVTEDMVGEWEMGCFLLDGVHYQAGMKGKLIVKP